MVEGRSAVVQLTFYDRVVVPEGSKVMPLHLHIFSGIVKFASALDVPNWKAV